MPIAEADVQASLRALTDPNTGRDFVSTKSVRKVDVDGSNVVVDLQLAYPARSQHEALRRLVARQLGGLPGIGKVSVNIGHKIASHAVQRGVKLVAGVKNIIAVRAARAASASRRPRSTWRWRWPRRARRSGCSTRTSMGPRNR